MWPRSICGYLISCTELGARRWCNERGRPGEDGAGGEPEGTALAGDAGLFRAGGTASGEGNAQLRAVSVGVGGTGMRTAARESDPQAAEGLGAAVGEIACELQAEAIAGEGEPTHEGTAGGRLPGPQGEFAGLREPWRREESLSLCYRPGVDRDSSSEDEVHDMCAAGAGSVGGEARIAIAQRDHEADEIRWCHHRPDGIRAANPRGNGGGVYIVGGTLRTRQRVVDQQPAVLEVGRDLQGCHDHRGSDRSFGSSLRDTGTDHPELSHGASEKESVRRLGVSSRLRGGGARCGLCFHKKMRRAEGLWKKTLGGKVQNQDFPTKLGNPAKSAGFPLFPQPRRLLDISQIVWGKIIVVDGNK